MKLSDFLSERRIRFVEGVPELIDKKMNGEVIFYDLTKERLELINKNVIQQLKDDDDNKEAVVYKMFSYLVDIENDVDLETFKKMLDNPPNNQFALVEEEFMKSFNDIFNMAETKKRTEENIKQLKEKLPEQPKSKQELKNELLQGLGKLQENTPENKVLRKTIFLQLAELEE